MKILGVSTSSWSAANREFYRRLVKEGFEVKIALPAFWNFGQSTLNAEKKLTHDPDLLLLKPTSFHHRLYRLKGIKKHINTFKPDVIYFEGDPGSLMCAILGRIALKNGIKLFALSCENLSQSPIDVVKREGIRQFIPALIKYSLIKYSKNKIDTLLVINSKGLDYFNSLGFKRVIKTPLGFDETIFNINRKSRDKIRLELGLKDDELVIAYFGRLVYEKGVHLLIDALEQLDLKNCKLLMDNFGRYANPYQKTIYDKIMSSSLKENTIFFESKHLEIANYMNASDITVLPSISTMKWLEQYGRVVPEAGACGNLVIVSDSGAPKEFFNKSYPFKFKSGDTINLKEVILKAKETIEKQSYDKSKSSKKIIENFSLLAQVNLFKKLID